MSKQDEYRFSFVLMIRFENAKSLLLMKAAVSKTIDSNKRMSASIKKEGKNLVINIKAKDINMLRATVNTISETVKMLESVDKI
ncbi:CTAG/PCC1 family protein [Candidatus Parvarchaeota archaeon]|nr:CTAG/PCC1 family protein [Candidatus Parvarchaeota archaeon]